MNKIFIVFVFSVFLFGCGGDNLITKGNGTGLLENNIEISLGTDKWRMELPDNWEKLKAFPEKGIIFLARKGTQNIVITNEKGFTENIIERLFKTLKEDLPIVTEVFKDENSLIFRGKLSSTTPMREFYQKVSGLSDGDGFLLISCSEEVVNLDNLECSEILDSFVFVE